MGVVYLYQCVGGGRGGGHDLMGCFLLVLLFFVLSYPMSLFLID